MKLPPLVIAGCLLVQGASAFAETVVDRSEPFQKQTITSEPRRPRAGDKLGYSKEESIRRLDPEVRQRLDVFLRMYREPGLFTKKRAALAVLGVDQFERRLFERSTNMPNDEPTHFEDRFAKQGVFSRKGWVGFFAYWGWTENGLAWGAKLSAKIDRNIECIDSKAVEGYLDLFLETGIEGRAHPAPRELWDRHGFYGQPYAKTISPLTPGLGLQFTQGCLSEICVYGKFYFKDIGDDNVLDKTGRAQ